MLEWYRARAPYQSLFEDCAELIAAAAAAVGTERLRFRSATADATEPPEILSVAEAFRRYAGVDLVANL